MLKWYSKFLLLVSAITRILLKYLYYRIKLDDEDI